MTGLAFTIPGPPRGQARPRASTRGGFVRMHTEPKDTSYAALVQFHALGARPLGWNPLTGPVEIAVDVVQKMPGPTVWKRTQKKGYPSTTKPDCSNILKLIEDALNGIAYVDDRQIAFATVRKSVGDQGVAPRVSVMVTPIGTEPE